MADTFITVAEAAERSGVSAKTIRRAIRRGLLPAYRRGASRVWMLRPQDVDRVYAPRKVGRE